MDTWTWGTLCYLDILSGARDTSGFRCDKPESLFVLESIKLMEVRYLTLETLYPARDFQSLMAPGL